jgi:hypothetical protein
MSRIFHRREWLRLSSADVSPFIPGLPNSVRQIISSLSFHRRDALQGDENPNRNNEIDALNSWINLIESIARGETPPESQPGPQE